MDDRNVPLGAIEPDKLVFLKWEKYVPCPLSLLCIPLTVFFILSR